jgi:hypothetical protein
MSSGSFHLGSNIIFTSNQLFFIFSSADFVAFSHAKSQSKQRKTFFVNLLIKVRCLSVKALHDTATTLLNQFACNAIVSICHSVIIMESCLLIAVLALNNQYNILDLSYKSEAGEFKYFGSPAPNILAVNATKSHLAF